MLSGRIEGWPRSRRSEGAAGSALHGRRTKPALFFWARPREMSPARARRLEDASLLRLVLATENHFFYGQSRTKLRKTKRDVGGRTPAHLRKKARDARHRVPGSPGSTRAAAQAWTEPAAA